MKLTIIQNSIDLTLKMDDLAAPAKSVDLSQGVIYVGFHKPLRSIYVEVVKEETPEEKEIDLKIFNGTEFVAQAVEDKTFGLSKSGFIFIGEVDQKETTISGKKQYWVTLSTASPAAVKIRGINLVLSDDTDFGLLPNISSYLPENYETFIPFHQEARNLIIQKIRNSGMVIRSYEKLLVRQVDQFDILEIEEFRQAAKYMALHLIFDEASKGTDDQYAIKAAKFLERSEEALSSRMRSIDENDDGKASRSENSPINSIRIKRE